MNVFIARDGATIGEFPRESLEEMARAGELQADDHYWQEGMDDWLPLSQLLAPDAWAPPPPPNYRLFIGIGAAALAVIALIGFLLVKPARIGPHGSAPTIAPAATPPMDYGQVRDKAAAELQQMIDRLPSRAEPPLNSFYYDVTVNMNRSLQLRAPWTAIIRGREDTIDPQTGISVSQTDFTLTADYENGEWLYSAYQANASGMPSGITDDGSSATPPSVVSILGLKTRQPSSGLSLKLTN